MSEISIADSAFVGFGILARRPLTVLAWGAVFVAAVAAVCFAFGPILLPAVGVLAKLSPDAATAASSPEFAALIVQLGGFVLVLLLVMLVVQAVLTAAAYRAVLQPDQSRFAYLRLGGQEAWLILLAVVRGFLVGAAQLAFSVPAIAIETSGSANPALSGLSAALRLISFIVGIYLAMKFSLSGPMTFAERRFRLFESWTATRGRFGQLLLVALLIGVVMVGIYLLVVIIFFAGMAGFMGPLMTPGSKVDPSRLLATITPMLVFGALFATVIAGAVNAITQAPWAHAYRQLRPPSDVAANFA